MVFVWSNYGVAWWISKAVSQLVHHRSKDRRKAWLREPQVTFTPPGGKHGFGDLSKKGTLIDQGFMTLDLMN